MVQMRGGQEGMEGMVQMREEGRRVWKVWFR